MDKINFIFRQLLDYRRNTAIDFADADSQAKTYSGQIYWEYLKRLKEAINDYLSSFDFTCQIVIKESVVSIEIFSPSVGDVPYMTFSFGATSEINKSTCSNFTLLGFYSYNRTKLDIPLNHIVQPIAVIDNLEKQLQIFDACELKESVETWRSFVIQK